MIIASTPYEIFRNELLNKPKGFNISEVLAEGRKFEALSAGNNQLQELGMSQKETIHGINRGRKCKNCDTSHKPRQCPAYHDECSACGNMGHWSKCCRISKQKKNPRPQSRGRRQQPHHSQHRSKSRKPSNRKNNQSIDNVDISDDENYHKHFYSITVSDKCMDSITEKSREEAYTTLKIKPPHIPNEKCTLRLKIDSGASGNTLPIRTFQQMYGTAESAFNILKPATHTKLTSYSGDTILCRGTINIPCQYKESKWVNAIFYVVDVPGPAVVGLPTSEQLKLITINVAAINNARPQELRTPIVNVKQLKQAYPEQFDRIGNFSGTAKLHLKEDAEPFIDPPRKCSIHLKDQLKEEIEKLIEQDVLRKVEEHTDWCSSLAYSIKKDGSLRICIDPQKLNSSLKRCPYKIPTVEELNPKFAKAKVFSKLDAKAGYWSVHLDEKSQLLTTCRTPFGRVCWKRLPFGLSVSQDIFQARMDQILEGLDGVVSITDDVAVYGENEEDHDRNLQNLMTRAAETGLVFNSEKCTIKQTSITFFGNIYTATGIKPDPAKIRDIQKMPSPQNKDELQRFLGMLNYLSPYIPNFADKAHPVRTLLKSESPWIWDPDHQKCYDELKELITADTLLSYYDKTKPISLEVDASQKGLGVALVQEGKPVAFGSKTLTDCQSRYSNIEREMLAIVHGIQRYHTYLYATTFTVITDHKPLVTICAKPLHSAPPRLQRMLLKIQGYNYRVMYRPGKDMILADVLSRLPNPENNNTVELDERIDGITTEDDDGHATIAAINFSAEKQIMLRNETARDKTLNLVKEIIFQGWPETIRDVPTDIRPYWSFRDELAAESGILFKGQQVLIPESMQQDILRQLHQAHQGIEKTRRLARETVYWININKDIEKMCQSCTLCQQYQDANKREPLEPHDIPSRPWKYLASDLFEINGQQYLLTVDRYTKYPLVDEMPSPVTSKAVADKIKGYTSLFGRPDEIMTDNGPQYTGQAFQNFIASWDIKHITSSPHYAKSNGFIERHVRHIKSILTKCIKSKSDIQLALLQVRATPIDSKLPSPAELLFGRAIATTLPSREKLGKEEHRARLEERSAEMKTRHDYSSQNINLPPLYPGQHVTIMNKADKTWYPGIIIRKDKTPRSYIVETPNGARLRRNRAHLRAVPAPTTKKNNLADVGKKVHFADTAPSMMPAAREHPTSSDKEIPTTPEEVRSPTDRTRTRSGRTIIRPARFRD